MSDDSTLLRQRLLHELREIAPRSTTKEKLARKLLTPDINCNRRDLNELLKKLKSERWVWSTFENYFYLTEERIATQEAKEPGYAQAVEYYRTGGGELPKNGKKPVFQFTVDWCKVVIGNKDFRDRVFAERTEELRQVVNLLNRVWNEYSMPDQDNIQDYDEEEVHKVHFILEDFFNAWREKF